MKIAIPREEALQNYPFRNSSPYLAAVKPH